MLKKYNIYIVSIVSMENRITGRRIVDDHDRE